MKSKCERRCGGEEEEHEITLQSKGRALNLSRYTLAIGNTGICVSAVTEGT